MFNNARVTRVVLELVILRPVMPPSVDEIGRVAPSEQEQAAGTAYAAHNVIQCIANQEESSMSHSEARFLARMLFGRTRTLSDEQRSEQSERARKTITKEELWWRGRIGRLEDKIHSRAGLMPPSP